MVRNPGVLAVVVDEVENLGLVDEFVGLRSAQRVFDELERLRRTNR